MASQDCHCAKPALGLVGGLCLRALDGCLREGTRRGLFHLVHEAPCNSARNVVFAEEFFHRFKTFLDRVPCRYAVTAEHVSLVLVL